MVRDLLICIIGSRGHVLDLTVPSAHKALRDDDVVAGRVPAKSCTILADDVDIVEQLPFDSLQNQNVHVQVSRRALNALVLRFLQDPLLQNVYLAAWREDLCGFFCCCLIVRPIPVWRWGLISSVCLVGLHLLG